MNPPSAPLWCAIPAVGRVAALPQAVSASSVVRMPCGRCRTDGSCSALGTEAAAANQEHPMSASLSLQHVLTVIRVLRAVCMRCCRDSTVPAPRPPLPRKTFHRLLLGRCYQQCHHGHILQAGSSAAPRLPMVKDVLRPLPAGSSLTRCCIIAAGRQPCTMAAAPGQDLLQPLAGQNLHLHMFSFICTFS